MSDKDLIDVLSGINISQDIKDILNGFSDNAVDRRTDEVKESFKEKLMSVLKISNTNTETYDYIEKMSTMYTNTIFPSAIYNKIAEGYNKYRSMINMLFFVSIIFVAVSVILIVYHLKSQDWLLIGIYNLVIFGIILIMFFSYMNNIFVQNVRVTFVISGAINNMLKASSIITVALGIISVVLNLKHIKNGKQH